MCDSTNPWESQTSFSVSTSGNTSGKARHTNVVSVAFISAVLNQFYYLGGSDMLYLGTRCGTILAVLISVPSTVESIGVQKPVILPVLPLWIRICISYRNSGKNQDKFSLLGGFCLNLGTAFYCRFHSYKWGFFNSWWWSMKPQNHSAQTCSGTIALI